MSYKVANRIINKRTLVPARTSSFAVSPVSASTRVHLIHDRTAKYDQYATSAHYENQK